MIQQDYEQLFVQLGKRELQRYLQKKLKQNFEILQSSFIKQCKQFYQNNKLRASIINQKGNYQQQPNQDIQQYLINNKLDINFIYLYICIICYLNGSTDVDNLIESHMQNSMLQLQSVMQQSDLQDLQSSLHYKDQQLRNVSKQSQVAIQENADLQGKLQLLQDQIDVQTKQIEQLQNSKIELVNQKHSLEEQIVMLRTMQSTKELEDSHKQIQQKLIQQCKEVNNENTKLKIQLNEQILQIQTLKQQNDDKQIELNMLQQRIDKLQNNDDKQKLQQQFAHLQTQYEEIQKIKLQLQSDYEIQQQKVLRLEKENKLNSEQLQQAKLQLSLQEQNNQQNEQNDQLLKQNNDLKQQIQNLNQIIDTLQNNDDIQKNQQLNQKNQELTQQLQDLQTINNQLEQNNKKYLQQVQQLQNQNNDMKQMQQDVNKYIEKSMDIEKKKYLQQMDNLNQQISQLQKQLNEANQQRTFVQHKPNEKLSYDELYNEYEQLKQDKEFLEQFKLKELLNDNAAKEVQIAQLLDKLSDMGMNNDDMQNIQQQLSDSIKPSIQVQENTIDLKRKIQNIIQEDDRIELQQEKGMSSLDALDLEPDEFFQKLKDGKINEEKQLRERLTNIKQQLKAII